MTTSAFIPAGTYAELRISRYQRHEQPPHDQPEILWAACIPWPYPHDRYGAWDEVVPCTHCLRAKDHKPCGYHASWRHGDTRPIRMHSPEAKAKRRRDNLRKRIMKKAPLFLDQLMQREIAKNPDYYNPAAIARQPTTADIIADIEAESDAAMTAQFRR